MSEVRKATIKLNMAKAKEQHKTNLKSMTDRLKNVSSKPMSEISKYSLASYQQKAADDLRNKSVDQGSSIAMKVAGMKPIVDTDKNRKRMSNRVIGIGRAANKLTQKTNEENIDELKTPTLKSYISKASKDIEQKQSGKGFPFGTGKDRSKIIKRDLAIDKAKGRLSMNRQLGRAEESVQEDVDEGVLGALGGGIVGGMVGGPAGAALGAYAGHKMQQQKNKIKKLQKPKVATEDKDLDKVVKDLQAAIQGVKKHAKAMNEDGHQDVASARRKAVLIMEDAAQILMKLKNMDPMDSLPSWWMNKMAVTAAYMDSMRNYLLVPSEMPSDNMPDMSTEANHEYGGVPIKKVPENPKHTAKMRKAAKMFKSIPAAQRGTGSAGKRGGDSGFKSVKVESYSMPSSDTNVADKYRKKSIPQQVSEKKKKKPKLTPTGPFVSFGTGSYTDSGNGGMGEEVDKEKMKNLDNVMKMYKNRKPLKDLVGRQGPGMKRVKAKMDAIPSTDKAGRVSRSRMQKKFGRNINFD